MAITKYIIVVNYSNTQIIRPQKVSDENTTVLKMQFLAWTRWLSGLRKSMLKWARGHRDYRSAVGIAILRGEDTLCQRPNSLTDLCLQNLLLSQCPLQRRLHLHLAELFDREVQMLKGFLFLIGVMFQQ
jgi:hypothetical protein